MKRTPELLIKPKQNWREMNWLKTDMEKHRQLQNTGGTKTPCIHAYKQLSGTEQRKTWSIYNEAITNEEQAIRTEDLVWKKKGSKPNRMNKGKLYKIINQSTFIYIAPYNNHRLTKMLHNYRNRFKAIIIIIKQEVAKIQEPWMKINTIVMYYYLFIVGDYVCNFFGPYVGQSGLTG